MITTNDFIGMLGNKMRNEVLKAVIRSNNLSFVAEKKCDFIDLVVKTEHFSHLMNVCYEYELRRKYAILQFLLNKRMKY